MHVRVLKHHVRVLKRHVRVVMRHVRSFETPCSDVWNAMLKFWNAMLKFCNIMLEFCNIMQNSATNVDMCFLQNRMLGLKLGTFSWWYVYRKCSWHSCLACWSASGGIPRSKDMGRGCSKWPKVRFRERDRADCHCLTWPFVRKYRRFSKAWVRTHDRHIWSRIRGDNAALLPRKKKGGKGEKERGRSSNLPGSPLT